MIKHFSSHDLPWSSGLCQETRAFRNMTVPAESIIRAEEEEEDTVCKVLKVIKLLKVPIKFFQRMFIAQWVNRKMAGSTTASRGVVFHDLHTPKYYR